MKIFQLEKLTAVEIFRYRSFKEKIAITKDYIYVERKKYVS